MLMCGPFSLVTPCKAIYQQKQRNEGILMIDLQTWIGVFLDRLTGYFGERIWFVGLQGSYGRGEATETSDLDMVVILDDLLPSDISKYHAMLETLPNRELLCGFLSGKAEILHWEPSDLFQFYYDTVPIKGSLDEVMPRIDDAAVEKAIRTGVCNLYHGCIHNMLYDKSDDLLRDLYKGASFVVQAIIFRQTGSYFRNHADLYAAASPEEQTILRTFRYLKNGGGIDFSGMSESLFIWAKHWIAQ